MKKRTGKEGVEWGEKGLYLKDCTGIPRVPAVRAGLMLNQGRFEEPVRS